MPYSDNHSGAAQDRAMGTGTGPGGIRGQAEKARFAKFMNAQAAAAQARIDAKAKHGGGIGTTIIGGSARATITRERIGTFLQIAHHGSLGTETVLIPPDMVAGVIDALRSVGNTTTGS